MCNITETTQSKQSVIQSLASMQWLIEVNTDAIGVILTEIEPGVVALM